jgi:replicative DNA helicase
MGGVALVTTLRLVPDPDETVPNENELPHLADEHAQKLIAALMYLDADEAQEVFDLLPDTAFHDPTGRWAYQLIRAVVRAGQGVDPVTILVAGRHQRRGDEGSAGAQRAPTADQQHQLALYLVDACNHTATRADPVSCAHDVLDNASWRNSHARENSPDRTDLGELTNRIEPEERGHP